MPRTIAPRYASFNADYYTEQEPRRKKDNTLRNLGLGALGVGALAAGGYGVHRLLKKGVKPATKTPRLLSPAAPTPTAQTQTPPAVVMEANTPRSSGTQRTPQPTAASKVPPLLALPPARVQATVDIPQNAPNSSRVLVTPPRERPASPLASLRQRVQNFVEPYIPKRRQAAQPTAPADAAAPLPTSPRPTTVQAQPTRKKQVTEVPQAPPPPPPARVTPKDTGYDLNNAPWLSDIRGGAPNTRRASAQSISPNRPLEAEPPAAIPNRRPGWREQARRSGHQIAGRQPVQPDATPQPRFQQEAALPRAQRRAQRLGEVWQDITRPRRRTDLPNTSLDLLPERAFPVSRANGPLSQRQPIPESPNLSQNYRTPEQEQRIRRNYIDRTYHDFEMPNYVPPGEQPPRYGTQYRQARRNAAQTTPPPQPQVSRQPRQTRALPPSRPYEQAFNMTQNPQQRYPRPLLTMPPVEQTQPTQSDNPTLSLLEMRRQRLARRNFSSNRHLTKFTYRPAMGYPTWAGR